MARIKLTRRPLYTLVELQYKSSKNGEARYAVTTMGLDVTASSPEVQEFKRRVLRLPKKVTK